MQGDTELVAAARQGDLASFEALVALHQARVFRVARRYARSEVDAQDIVQEAFIKAFRNLPNFRGEAPFEHWLMRLTVRCCYDYLRSVQRKREMVWTDLGEEAAEWLDQFVAAPERADDQADAARELIGQVLARLSAASRLVITLLEIEEHSVKEISQLTGWSVPLVKVRAFRARREMRRILESLLAHKKV